MNVLTAIRMIMALCRAANISVVDLAKEWMNEEQNQADFDELIAIINAGRLQ